MQKTLLLLLFLLVSIINIYGQSSNSSYIYTKYADFLNQEGEIILVLEIGMTSPHNGYLHWRLTNNSQKTLYKVALEPREFILANGEIEKRLSWKMITREINPGEVKVTNVSEIINPTDNKYDSKGKAYNNNPVKQVKVRLPVITFYLEPSGGDEIRWDTIGTIEFK